MIPKKLVSYLFVSAPPSVLLEVIDQDALVRHLRTLSHDKRVALLSGIDVPYEKEKTSEPLMAGDPEELDETARLILGTLMMGEMLSIADIAERSGVDAGVTERRVKAFVAMGKLERKGRTKDSKYFDPSAASMTLANGPETDDAKAVREAADEAFNGAVAEVAAS